MAETFRCDSCGKTGDDRREKHELYLCPPGIEAPYHADLCKRCAWAAVESLGFLKRPSGHLADLFDPRLGGWHPLKRLWHRGG